MARKPKAKPANVALERPVMAAEAESPENTLEPSHVPEKPAAKRHRAKNAKSREAPAVAEGEPHAARTPPDKLTEIPSVPQEIRERFIGIGSEYFFPDGAPAFKDHGSTLSTRSENTEVIRSMVTIAQSRGWSDITVKGTERFKKDAWFAAQLVGIAVRGYDPSAFEREHIVRALARRAAGRTVLTTDRDATRDGSVPGGAFEAPHDPTRRRDGATGDTLPRGNRNARDASPGQSESDSAWTTGRLVDHGRAHYRHDHKEPMSYFVRLETDRGDREIWGVDLERAFRESLTRPTMGDEVTVWATGRDRVRVPVEVKDNQGRVVGKDEIETHRNHWIVERSDFLRHRAALAKVIRDPNITPEDGAKRHPELQGTYLQLQIAKQGAERDIGQPEDRSRFVARAREALADRIERGEPLEPVRMRERAADRVQDDRARGRDLAPTR